MKTSNAINSAYTRSGVMYGGGKGSTRVLKGYGHKRK